MFLEEACIIGGMDKAIFDFFGTNKTWDKISDILLLMILMGFCYFAFLGVKQLIERKSLKKVDKELVWMLPSLCLMLVVYFVFEKMIIIHYRPILVDGVAEPSFPSTHTMAAMTLGLLMMIALPKYVKNKNLRITLKIVLPVLVALIAFGRIASGMHWLTDVLGGIGFGTLCGLVYFVILKAVKCKTNE